MKLRSNLIANYVGQGWSAAMSLAFVPVYIRYLGIESYALIGIYAALQAWLALLDLGMSPTLQREMARFSAGSLTPTGIRDLLRSVELVSGGVALAVIVIVAGGADYIATDWLRTALPAETVSAALMLMGAVVALRFLESLYRSALYGLERQVWFNVVNVVLTTARFGGAALVIAAWRPTIATFFWCQLAVSLVGVLALSTKLHRLLPSGERRARFSLEALGEIKGFAVGMIGINFTALILTQADKVILSRLLPLSEFGHYTLAFTMCGVIVALSGPVMQAAYPALVRLHAAGDEDAFAQTYHRSAQILAAAAASVAVVLGLFAPEVLWVWTGDKTLTGAVWPLLSVFAAGTFLNVLMQTPYFALLAIGETRFPLRLNVVLALVLIMGLLVFVPRYGAMAGSAAWLLLNFASLAIGLPLLHRKHLRGLLRPWLLHDTGPTLLAVMAFGLALRIPTWSFEGTRLSWLVGLGVIGGATLGVALLATPACRTILAPLIRRPLPTRGSVADPS